MDALKIKVSQSSDEARAAIARTMTQTSNPMLQFVPGMANTYSGGLAGWYWQFIGIADAVNKESQAYVARKNNT
jgi:hypothetical protein